MAQTGKNLPVMQETQVRSLDWEDPLEEGMATHSGILAWRILWTEEPGGLYSSWGHKESDTTERHSTAQPPLYSLLHLNIYFLAKVHGIWDLSSPTKGQTRTPSVGSIWNLNQLDHQRIPKCCCRFS